MARIEQIILYGKKGTNLQIDVGTRVLMLQAETPEQLGTSLFDAWRRALRQCTLVVIFACCALCSTLRRVAAPPASSIASTARCTEETERATGIFSDKNGWLHQQRLEPSFFRAARQILDILRRMWPKLPWS